MHPSSQERAPQRRSHLIGLAALLLTMSHGPRADAEQHSAPPPVEPEPTQLVDTTPQERVSPAPPFQLLLEEWGKFVKEHPLGVRINFWDPDGKPRFNNWQTWVEPLTLEVGYPVAAQMFHVSVPYEFAPNFEITEPTSDTAFQEMKREMLERLRTAWLEEIMAIPGSFFKDEVTIWDGNKPITDRHWSRAFEVSSRERVSSIAITGSASPEHAVGDRALGDYYNEQLARRRGDDAQQALLQYLPYLAMDDLPVEFTVPEYTAEELDELIRVGHEIGLNPADSTQSKLLAVIFKYNHREIKQPKLEETVRRIVGEKRSVQLEVNFENGRQGVWQIPIPALALLGLYVALRYAERRNPQPGTPPNPPAPQAHQPRGERRRPERHVPPTGASEGGGSAGGTRPLRRRNDN